MHKLLLGIPHPRHLHPRTVGTPHATVLGMWLKSALVEGHEYPTSIVFRHGLLAMRLASILTIFRKWDDYRYAKEYCCTDADFDTAMQIIATVIRAQPAAGHDRCPTPDARP